MLRYFIAWTLWIVAVVSLLLARGYARRSPDKYTIFGVGWIEPEWFWCVIAICVAAGMGCFVLWHRSRQHAAAANMPRGFEVLPQHGGTAA